MGNTNVAAPKYGFDAGKVFVSTAKNSAGEPEINVQAGGRAPSGSSDKFVLDTGIEHWEITESDVHRRLDAMSRRQMLSVLRSSANLAPGVRKAIGEELWKVSENVMLYYNDDSFSWHRRVVEPQDRRRLSKRLMFTGSEDATIKVWDLESMNCLATFNNEGKVVLALKFWDNQLITGGDDCVVRHWDFSNGKYNRALSGHNGPVSCLAFDNKWIVSGSVDKTIKVWDARFGTVQWTLWGHNGTVQCLQFNGKELLSGSADGMIKMWDLATGECTETFKGHESSVLCMTWDNEDLFLTGSEEGVVFLWKARGFQRTEVVELTHEEKEIRKRLPRSEWLDTLATTTIKGKPFESVEAHDAWVTAIQLHSKTNVFVTGSNDRVLKLWSLKTLKVISHMHGHEDSIWAVDICSRFVYSSSKDGTSRVWGRGSGECIKVLQQHIGGIHTMMLVRRNPYIDAHVRHRLRDFDGNLDVGGEYKDELFGPKPWQVGGSNSGARKEPKEAKSP